MDSIKKRKMWDCIKSVPYLDTLDENVTEQYIILKVKGTCLENVEPVLIILFSLLLILFMFGFILRLKN
jgi:hypothetical protein|tara:strand:+ start:316 stop:522 length:207 start_codon:yes stop_codon:yes gene_type:complete